jgi:hypothetical protein
MVEGMGGIATMGLALILAAWIGAALIPSARICAASMLAELMPPTQIDGALIGAAEILAAVLEAACNTLGPSGSFVIRLSSLNVSGSLSVPV